MSDMQFLKELYETIEQHTGGGFEDVIAEKASYPYLYHLSEIRQNLIDWIPMDEGAQVLECNAECGALTGKLLDKAAQVTALVREEEQKKLLLMRHGMRAKRLTVLCENEFWGDVEHEKFNYIFIVGDFYRFCDRLEDLRRLLKVDGRLVVADANRLGLKYFAGCADEYQGTYFSGMEGYGNGQVERCYSRSEYETILRGAGFEKMQFYYPYPDYKFPNSIYSEEWLPGQGELLDNRRNFDRDRLQLFDEAKVFDALLAEGVFGTFCNSYLIEASV